MKIGFITLITTLLISIAGWVTHLWWSLSGLFTGTMDKTNEYVIAVLGVFIPPIGAIHGIYLWF